MVTNARKTDAQRLGNGKKAFSVKQVETLLENATGTEYTAGTGITIVDNTISVDTTIIPTNNFLKPGILNAAYSIRVPKDTPLPGWKVYDKNNDWGNFVTDNLVNQDLVIVIFNSVNKSLMLVPKGTPSGAEFTMPPEYLYYEFMTMKVAGILQSEVNTTHVLTSKVKYVISESNGVITVDSPMDSGVLNYKRKTAISGSPSNYDIYICLMVRE